MDFLSNIVDFLLHFDVHLSELIADFGPWIYVLIFLVITGETGLVIAPILPGDSLLFAAGTFAARGDLNVWILFASLSVAAVLGDALNYTVGRYLGPKFFRKEGDGTRFFKKENLDRTHDFFVRYGPATIIIARFLPIVRTFAPFVAGMGRMGYPRFLIYNVDRRHRLGGVVHLRRLLLRQHPLRRRTTSRWSSWASSWSRWSPRWPRSSGAAARRPGQRLPRPSRRPQPKRSDPGRPPGAATRLPAASRPPAPPGCAPPSDRPRRPCSASRRLAHRHQRPALIREVEGERPVCARNNE